MKKRLCIWTMIAITSALRNMDHFLHTERIPRGDRYMPCYQRLPNKTSERVVSSSTLPRSLILQGSEEPGASGVILDAVADTLRASWVPSGTVVLITDGRILGTDVFSFLRKFGTDIGISVFEIPVSVLESSPTERASWLQNLQLMRSTTYGLTLVIRSDSEDFLLVFLKEGSELGLFAWPCRILVATLLRGDGRSSLKDVLSKVNAMVIVGKDERRYDIILYQPYSLRELVVAHWYYERGLQHIENVPMFPEKFHKFSDGAHLYVADDEFTPYVSVQLLLGSTENGKQNFTFRGPMMKFLELLSADMNFTYSLKRSPDGTWGYVQANGTATGLVGLLARKEADISLGPFAVTQNRAQVMDYTHAITDDQMASIGSTGSTEIDVWAFVMPLTFKVWLSIFASLFLVIVTMHMLVRATGVEMNDKIFVFVSILIVQGSRDLEKRTWQRMIIGAWIISTAILVFSYSGNLMSLLAVRYIPQPYQTLRDVLDDPDITMVWEINTAYVHAFRKATSGDLLRVKELDDRHKIVYVFSTDYHKTLNTLVISGHYVLILEAISIKMLMGEQFTSTGKCQFYMSKGKFMPNVFAVGVQKKGPLLRPLNKRISSLTQSGIYQHWLNNELRNATTCLTAPPKIIVQSALSIRNIWGIFMILVIGEGIGVGILLLELMVKKCTKKF